MILPEDSPHVKRASRAASIAYLRRVVAAAREIMDAAPPGSPKHNVGKMARDQITATLEEIEIYGEPISSFTHRLPS